MFVRSIYPYNGPFGGSLRFPANELFLKIREENEHWFLVSRSDGTIGCVPYNYVQPVENHDQQTIIRWAKQALSFLKTCSSSLKNRQAVLEALCQLSKESASVYSDIGDSQISPDKPVTVKSTRHAPSPPISGMESGLKSPIFSPGGQYSNEPTENIDCDTRAFKGLPVPVQTRRPIPARNTPAIPVSMKQTGLKPQDVSLPDGLAPCLVDVLRLGTDARRADCQVTLLVLLDILTPYVPEMRPYAAALERTLTESTSDQRRLMYMRSPDWYLLKRYFTSIEKREADKQESTWQLHDDTVAFGLLLDGLTDLLVKTNTELVQFFLNSVKYRPFQSVIRLYQMESRPTVRRKSLVVSGACCMCDSTCLQIGLTSVLPSEIIRELGSVNNDSEISHISTSLRLLTVMFARASQLPVEIQNQLDSTFFTKILRLIGSSDTPVATCLIDFDDAATSSLPSTNVVLFDGQLTHAATIFLLACNWHFCTLTAKRASAGGDHTNAFPLLGALKSNLYASRLFMELVIQAFNQNMDPLFLVEFTNTSKSSNIDRLLRWVEVMCNFNSVSTANSLELAQNGAADSIFDKDEIDVDAPGGEDDGMYARSLWSVDARLHDKPKTSVKLPSSVSPTTPRHSVVKLLFDVFSTMDTATLVYDSDRDVIIDIISRQLRNLSFPQDEQILDFPVLLGLVIANSDYLSRGAYRSHELIESLEMMVNQELHETPSASVKRSLDLARISLGRLKSACLN